MICRHPGFFVLSVLLTSACEQPTIQFDDPNVAVAAHFHNRDFQKLDLLFVVDDSNNAEFLQTALTESFATWATVLTRGEIKPSIHMGVVSTDMGAGMALAECSEHGDSGRLQRVIRPECQGLRHLPYLSIEPDYIVSDPIFTGPVENAMSCFGNLGTAGCGLEQPLMSMGTALSDDDVLSRLLNQGFIRDEALLAVVIVTNEDDCSIHPDAFWNNRDPSSVSSFDCFSEGVVCDESDLSAPGAKHNCRAGVSPQMLSVRQTATWLARRKTNPAATVLAGVISPNEPVFVQATANGPTLASVCSFSHVTPAPRLHDFFSEFTGQSIITSACNESLADSFATVAAFVKGSLKQSGCVTSTVALTSHCVLRATWADQVQILKQCAVSEAPCFTLRKAEECRDVPGGLVVDIDRKEFSGDAEFELLCIAETN